MKAAVVIVVIILLSLLGYRRDYSRTAVSSFLSPVFLTECLYVVTGIILGPHLLGFLDENILDALTPLVLLGLGWIGLLFGIQLNFTDIARFPKSYFLMMLFQGILPFICVFGTMFWYFTPVSELPRGLILSSLLIFGAMAICTAQPTMAVISWQMKDEKGKLMRLLRYISSLDDIVALPFIALAFAYEGFHTIGGEVVFSWWDILLITILLGLLTGFILNLLVRLTRDNRELLLLVISMVILSVGISRYLNVSPIVMSAIAGIVLANMSPKRMEITRILLWVEKPFFLIFLIVSGALLTFSPIILVIVPLYIGMRLVGKITGGILSAKTTTHPFPVPAHIGLGLTPQGSMSVAIALSFSQTISEPLGQYLIFSVIASVLFHEALAPFFIRYVLKGAE
jgi:Kef-type K+ transport system membrane component KefB